MILKAIFVCLPLCGTSMIYSSELTIPNQFTDGQVTSASQMNENFSAIQAAVNDNNSRINNDAGSNTYVQGLVGFSTEKVNGQAGLYAMHKVCNDFSVGSRVCTGDEIVFSSYNAETAAALPGPENGVFPKAWYLEPYEGSYLASNYRNNCWGWSDDNPSIRADAVNSNLTKTYNYCNVEISVACCK